MTVLGLYTIVGGAPGATKAGEEVLQLTNEPKNCSITHVPLLRPSTYSRCTESPTVYGRLKVCALTLGSRGEYPTTTAIASREIESRRYIGPPVVLGSQHVLRYGRRILTV